jgi:antibiotic biosynthesis monooxygenase (ABM) superfamily enzyme
MANALFMVKSTISKEHEADWNQWYNDVHCRQILEFPGAIGARRLRAVFGEEHYQYLCVYEFDSPETFHSFWNSDHRRLAREDYEAKYGKFSTLGEPRAYESVWES